ncbi:MAG: peptide deformylase [bacterium]
MSLLQIVTYGDPILQKKVKPVKHIDDAVLKLITDMFETMYMSPGIGLAANQVGVPLNLCVIDIMPQGKHDPLVLINGVIQEKKGKIFEEEGCLSFPGISTKIRRWKWVKVSGINEKGLPVEIIGEDLLARALQHEIDHLSGRLIVDRVSIIQKLKIKRLVKKLKKAGLWKK